LLVSRNYKTGGMCRQQGRSTNADCQIAPQELEIRNVYRQLERSLRTELQRGTRQIQDSIAEETKEGWRVKKMHGQMTSNLDEKLAVNGQSYR
jgi:hypothetical protein